jgi:hypothetical protein
MSDGEPQPEWWQQWSVASGASSQLGTKRDWWLSRYKDGPGITGERAESSNGRLLTYKTPEAAQRAADKRNRQK